MELSEFCDPLSERNYMEFAGCCWKQLIDQKEIKKGLGLSACWLVHWLLQQWQRCPEEFPEFFCWHPERSSFFGLVQSWVFSAEIAAKSSIWWVKPSNNLKIILKINLDHLKSSWRYLQSRFVDGLIRPQKHSTVSIRYVAVLRRSRSSRTCRGETWFFIGLIIARW